MLKIKKLHNDAKVPQRANSGDAGLDLCTIESATISPGCHATLKTGLAFAIPDGMVGLVWPRSKLASKYGLDILAGVVDSGYSGEVMVSVINHGKTEIEIRKGDKIAQMIIQSHYSDQQIIVADDLGATDRGSSGINDSELRIR